MKLNAIEYFNRHIDKFKSHYNPAKLFEKLEKTAKKIGVKGVYAILILYYSLIGGNASLKEKAMIIAALGYFILPTDFIPDIMGLIGFTDDFTVIWYVFRRIRKNVTEDIKEKARSRIASRFPSESSDSRFSHQSDSPTGNSD